MSEQTNMTNPPSEQTKNVKGQDKKQKMFKVKCLRDFALDRPGQERIIVKPGQIIEVTREEARHLVKHAFKSYCQFSGERHFDEAKSSAEAIKMSQGVIYKAELVKEPVLDEGIEDQAS